MRQMRQGSDHEVGWALLGTGRVCAQTADALRRTPGARAVTVLSRDGDRGRRFAAAHGVERVASSLQEVLADERVHVVYVASPNGLHVDQVVAASEAGRHVLCEKPMATDVDGCRTMSRACAAARVHLAIGFQYRQHPAHQRMRELVRSGALGRLVMADAAICLPPMETPSWYLDPQLAGGGVVPMSGVHRLDLLAFMLARGAQRVSAFTTTQVATRPFEDVAVASVAYEGDVLATVRFAMDVPHGGDVLTIHGTDGSVVATGTTTQWWGGGGGEVALRSGEQVQTTRYDSVDLYQRQVEAFLALLRGEATSLAGPTDGAAAVAVARALATSARTGRAVTVPETGIDHGKDTTP